MSLWISWPPRRNVRQPRAGGAYQDEHAAKIDLLGKGDALSIQGLIEKKTPGQSSDADLGCRLQSSCVIQSVSVSSHHHPNMRDAEKWVEMDAAVDSNKPESLSAILQGTIVVVDMVGYNDIARILEENIDATGVAELNRQIQSLIVAAQTELIMPWSHQTISNTGDGAIVFFRNADDAHRFGWHVHAAAKRHNDKKSESSAQRWFRVGIATGDLSVRKGMNGSQEYAGTAIASAVRLEAAARPGQVLMDSNTFLLLSHDLQELYGPEETVHGKRKERFRVRRLTVAEQDPHSTREPVRRLSRRQAISLSTLTCGTVLGTCYLSWPLVARKLHPLPGKRFVALMTWPSAEPGIAAFIDNVLVNIQSRLRRAESQFSNLVILGSSDMPSFGKKGDGTGSGDLAPKDLAALWGANLVLALSVQSQTKSYLLHLRLLEADASKVLRNATLSIDPSRPSASAAHAARSAADLLDLPVQEFTMGDEKELQSATAAAQDLIVQGRADVNAPNDGRLSEAIEKFAEATAKFPHLAIAYAELGRAYIRQFAKTWDPEFLDLAEQNLKMAIGENPDSTLAHLGTSRVLTERGQYDKALEEIAWILSRDPENTDALFAKGNIFGKAARYKEEEQVFVRLTRLRPSYWRVFNQLGVSYHHQAKYEAAEKLFRRASHIAPRVAMPVANLGVIYSETGRREEALKTLTASNDLTENETASSALGDIAFEDGDYHEALGYFGAANRAEPNNHITWSDMGDTYQMLGLLKDARRCFEKARHLLSVSVSVNPADGGNWMMLGLYHAKLGDSFNAMDAISKAEALSATDVDSTFIKARALAALGQTTRAVDLVLECLDHKLSIANVNLAIELDAVRASPKYKLRLKRPAEKEV